MFKVLHYLQALPCINSGVYFISFAMSEINGGCSFYIIKPEIVATSLRNFIAFDKLIRQNSPSRKIRTCTKQMLSRLARNMIRSQLEAFHPFFIVLFPSSVSRSPTFSGEWMNWPGPNLDIS